MKKYVQYGCGLSSPEEWINFDSSPTLRIQRLPVIGSLVKKRLNVVFPTNIRYGDIVKGLPLDAGSCDGLYCSHVLEHLSRDDFYKALKNSYGSLKEGGIFRLVMPDLESLIKSYMANKEAGNAMASDTFIRVAGVGMEKRKRGLRAFLSASFGNSNHLWLWDKESTLSVLKEIGFGDVRACQFNDSTDEMFRFVEEKSRFEDAVCFEMTK